MTNEFNKVLLASNITFLLKQKGIRIGAFEKAVNVSAGYLSRISNDESIKPGIEFVIKTANFLDTSIDILLERDLSALTATEQYFQTFIDKLIEDTTNEKLEWKCEKPGYLNNFDVDDTGRCFHPLFTVPEAPDGSGYADIAVFDSDAFGIDVTIDDDCYNVQLNDKTKLYVMHAKEDDMGEERLPEKVIELWFVNIPDKSSTFVGSTKSFGHLESAIKTLYGCIKNYIASPHLPTTVRNTIESYLNPKIKVYLKKN